MVQSDTVLFNKWCSSRDADAFAELLSRHAAMVYGACLRVVRNPGIAEEVSQECFLELMKGPSGVRSIGAWLHTVATRRALDRVKAEGRRNARERAYAATLDTAAEANWDDTREYVDEAIAELPVDLQLPIVLRFLEGRTHEAIAGELAISRSTVRSRIEKGIGLVRENLLKRDVVLSVGVLAAALESVGSTPAPAALVSELGRRALAMRAAPALWGTAVGAKYVAASLLLAGLAIAGSWAVFGGGEEAGSGVVVADAGGFVPEASPPPPDPVLLAAAVAPLETESAVEEVADSPPSEPVLDEEPKPAGWKLDLTPTEEIKESLQKTVNVEFKDIHVKDILEFMQDSFDVNIVLDPRVVAPEPNPRDGERIRLAHDYITDGHIRRISQREKTVEETLAVITGMLNLTYKIRGNVVWVSSSAQITRDLTVPLPSANFSEGDILDSIGKPVNIEFEDIHISDVLQFFQHSFDVTIELDPRVVMPEPKRGEEALPVSPNYVTDGMLDYINLKDIPLAEALYAMTRMLDLTYRVDRDAVFISTPDRITKSL